ncbi:FAD/NAD(P)-binding protein, partial [Kitasatospora purpeofusca]|uniref:FAD/NAD(P)-binding protein n=1 Tax=Kitasatospora purpeofusca TaxID=67352 RepID=UPI00364DBB4B
MTENPRRVAVVGAGASGVLTAAQLLRRAALAGVPLDVRLIDRGTICWSPPRTACRAAGSACWTAWC